MHSICGSVDHGKGGRTAATSPTYTEQNIQHEYVLDHPDSLVMELYAIRDAKEAINNSVYNRSPYLHRLLCGHKTTEKGDENISVIQIHALNKQIIKRIQIHWTQERAESTDQREADTLTHQIPSTNASPTSLPFVAYSAFPILTSSL